MLRRCLACCSDALPRASSVHVVPHASCSIVFARHTRCHLSRFPRHPPRTSTVQLAEHALCGVWLWQRTADAYSPWAAVFKCRRGVGMAASCPLARVVNAGSNESVKSVRNPGRRLRWDRQAFQVRFANPVRWRYRDSPQISGILRRLLCKCVMCCTLLPSSTELNAM